MSTSSMVIPANDEGPLSAEADGRRLGERVAVGDERVLVAVGPGMGEDPPIVRDAQARAVSTVQINSAAAMSTSLLEFMYLR